MGKEPELRLELEAVNSLVGGKANTESKEMKTFLCTPGTEGLPVQIGVFSCQLNLQEFVFGECPVPGVIAEHSCVIPGREKLRR